MNNDAHRDTKAWQAPSVKRFGTISEFTKQPNPQGQNKQLGVGDGMSMTGPIGSL